MLKRAFNISLPILTGAAMGVIYNLSDKYFINSFINTTELAKYNYTLLMILPIGLLFTPFFDVYWVPKFFSENKDVLNIHRTHKVSKIMFFIYLAFLPLYFLFVYYYTELTQDKINFKEIIFIMLLIYLSRVIDMSIQFYNNIFIIKENTKTSVTINVLVGALFLLLNYFLISYFGLIGAAITLLVTSLLRFSAYYYYIMKMINNSIVKL